MKIFGHIYGVTWIGRYGQRVYVRARTRERETGLFIIYRKRPVISPSLFRSSTMEIQLALWKMFFISCFTDQSLPVRTPPPRWWRLGVLSCYDEAVGGGESPFTRYIYIHTHTYIYDGQRFVFGQRLLRVCIIKTVCPRGRSPDGNSRPFTSLPLHIRLIYIYICNPFAAIYTRARRNPFYFGHRTRESVYIYIFAYAQSYTLLLSWTPVEHACWHISLLTVGHFKYNLPRSFQRSFARVSVDVRVYVFSGFDIYIVPYLDAKRYLWFLVFLPNATEVCIRVVTWHWFYLYHNSQKNV